MKLSQRIAKWAFSYLVDAANPKQVNRRPWEPITNGPLHQEVTDWDRVQLESKSNKLYWNLGPAKGIIDDKAMYSVGRSWLPIFKGEDKKWGDAARKWLVEQWYPLADIAGNDFQTHLYLCSVSIDRDGGVFPILTEYETGFPALQAIPSRMVCSDGYEETVKSGPYRGLRIYDGVIVNKTGTPVAFKVRVSEGKYEYYSARDMVNMYDPVTVDQLRGLPAFSHAILDLLNLRQVQEYEMLASALASSIGLIEHNETGMPDPNDPMVALTQKQVYGPQSDHPITTAEMHGGSIKYFRANSGSKIDTFKSDRPGDAWQKLQDRLIRNAAVGAGWPFEMAWDISALGGANTRLIIAKAMRAVEDRQDLLRPYAKRAVGYAVAKAIKEGLLPASDDWWRWDFTMPAKLTADYGRNKQADRDDYFAGLTSMTYILGEEGISLDDHIATLKNEQEALREAGLQKVESKQYEEDGEGNGEGKSEESLNVELLKQTTDAFGVAIRGGILTPSPDLEKVVRKSAGLPEMSSEVVEDWSKSGNVRKPITPAGADGSRPAPGQSAGQPDAEEEDEDEDAMSRHEEIMALASRPHNIQFTPPTVNISLPGVTIDNKFSVPEMKAPQVTVNVPKQDAPNIHVAASEAPVVNVAAPNVQVNVPPVNAQISLKRNKNGALESAKIES